MKYALTLFLIIISSVAYSCSEPYVSEAEDAADTMISELEDILTKKYHMKAIGESSSMPRGIIKKLGIKFQIEGPLSKEQLRKILVNAAQDFVSCVNISQKIRPFLENHPFTINNIELDIFIVDSNGYGLKHPDITISGIRKSTLDYLTLKRDKKIHTYGSEEYESYDEALKIVQEQAAKKNSVSTTNPNS